MTGEQYYNLDPEVKARLQKKSYFLFKSKHRWRKIEDRLNCGVEALEKQFDEQIALEGKKLLIMRKMKGEMNNVKELDRQNVRRNGGRGAKSSAQQTSGMRSAVRPTGRWS